MRGVTKPLSSYPNTEMISQNFIDKDREDKLGQQKETKEQLKDVQYSPLIAVVSQRRQFSKPSTC